MKDKRYLDKKVRVIFVAQVSGDKFGTFWRSSSGGLHRVKSPAMPMVVTKEEARRNLDAYAEKKMLRLVTTGGTDRESSSKPDHR